MDQAFGWRYQPLMLGLPSLLTLLSPSLWLVILLAVWITLLVQEVLSGLLDINIVLHLVLCGLQGTLKI